MAEVRAQAATEIQAVKEAARLERERLTRRLRADAASEHARAVQAAERQCREAYESTLEAAVGAAERERETALAQAKSELYVPARCTRVVPLPVLPVTRRGWPTQRGSAAARAGRAQR